MNPSKLEKMTGALLEGLVTEEQVDEIFQAVIKLITESTNKVDSTLSEQDGAIEDFGKQISALFDNTTASLESQQSVVDNAVSLVEELKAQVAEMVLEDGEDADVAEAVEIVLNEIEPKLEAIKAMIPEIQEQEEMSADEIRDKIASLEGDERLSVKQLKDWDVIEADFSRRMSRIGHGSASSTVSGASTWLSLTDTPNDYTSQALKVVQVNAAEDALEFVTLAGGGDALTANPLSQFSATTLAQLNGVISDATLVDTSALHDPVTVTDTAEIDLTLTGQDIQASIKANSVALSKIATVPTNRILGRATAGTGDVEALTAVQAADTIGVGTGDSPQFAGVNVGHATDTTITRVSAGVIAVEGTNVQLEPAEGGFADGDKTKLDAITGTNTGDEVIQSGAGAPATTPSFVGQRYVDTAADLVYIATGTASSADWDVVATATAGTPGKGSLLAGDGTDSFDEVTAGTNDQILVYDSAEALGVKKVDLDSGINFIIDGGGSAITTGVKGFVEIPFDCTIERVTLTADQSGSIVVDIWKDTYANYPPVDADSITASAVPTITTATKSQDSTLTGWTTAISAGDFIGFNVDSATTVTRVTVALKVRRNF